MKSGIFGFVGRAVDGGELGGKRYQRMGECRMALADGIAKNGLTICARLAMCWANRSSGSWFNIPPPAVLMGAKRNACNHYI
jgi:hypothetical protein